MRRWWLEGCLALGCQAALLLVWPYVLARYLVPVLPLALVALVSGASDAARYLPARVRPRARELIPGLLAAGILLGAIPQARTLVASGAACRYEGQLADPRCHDSVERAFFDATRFIAATTPDSARFLAAKEAAFYYYAHRQAVPIYDVADGLIADLPAFLSANHADFVFLSHLKIDEWSVAKPLLGMCGGLQVVRDWGPATVLLRVATGSGADSAAACAALRAYASAPWGKRGNRPAVVP